MNAATLIADYQKEYKRVNNRVPSLVYCRGWFTLDGNTVKLRRIELESALLVLKKRAGLH